LKQIITPETVSSPSIKKFYNGTLRVLLVLLHDFPEFLSEFAYSLCEYLPEQFTQIRNILLAAFPRNLRPPDPFSVANVYTNLILA
jgi:CCR4-NOT transcription complex subunit 1